MAWLLPKPLEAPAANEFNRLVGELAERLADRTTDLYGLVAELLAQIFYACPYTELSEKAPLAAFALHPAHITLEGEHYSATDPAAFARVKPLLWFWQCLDLTPLGQSVYSGVELRRALAPHIFKSVGKGLKCFQNVGFSVGYNLEFGDSVVLHRGVFLDDIGGMTIGSGTSFSEYANAYSHSHDVLTAEDVTLQHTIVGERVRVTYHATLLSGVRVGDDAIVGSMAVVTHDVGPHQVAMGIPARSQRVKVRDCPYCHAGDPHPSDLVPRPPDRKANPDYPEFVPAGQGTKKL